MSYKLFLDDLRSVKMVYPNLAETDFTIVRSYADFLSCIIDMGLPEFISFDNDLGEDESGTILPDGYAAAKWLVYESGLPLENLRFHVHSANPVAETQIESLLSNYINFRQHEK